jgi:DNA-binding XRE family transcriptional regulator
LLPKRLYGIINRSIWTWFCPHVVRATGGMSQFASGELTMTIIPPHGFFQQALPFTETTQAEQYCTLASVIANIARLDPFSLPSVPLDQRDKLPDVSGIYFALLDTKILYIGKSVNLQKRWQIHHRINQIRLLGNVSISWFHFIETEDLALERAEDLCIRYFKPTLNGTITPVTNTHTLQKVFGHRLVRLRKDRGITQEELSFRVGVSVMTVGRWERGEYGPEFDKLEALAKAIGIPIRSLFTFSDNPDL